MVEIKTKIRQWGNSMGIVIPKEEALRAGLAPGTDVEVTVKKNDTLPHLFGKYPLKGSTAKLLRDVDNELDPHDW